MSKTILVVEDDPLSMRLFVDLLEAAGHICLQAGTGDEAIRVAHAFRPDLIQLDIHLPVMSGIDVAKALKSDRALRTIPIIAVTALAMKGDAEKIMEIGIDAYISKPISVDSYLQAIGDALDLTENAD